VLDSATRASFSTSDGAASLFWSEWQEGDSLALSSDTIGGSQARIIVKAAATAEGLYVFAGVVDDSLVHLFQTGWTKSYSDGLGILIDTLNSQQVASCIRSGCSYYAGVTYSSQNLWVPVGSGSPTEPSAEPNWGWCEMNYYWFRYYGAQLADSAGIGVEWQHPSPNQCDLEFFVPWATLRLQPGATLAGRRFALSVAYDDVDADTANAAMLAWPSLPDPWHDGVWGDILLPESIGVVAPVSIALAPRCMAGLSVNTPRVSARAFYTIDGRRVLNGWGVGTARQVAGGSLRAIVTTDDRGVRTLRVLQ
jgi:hypothetical protein